MTTAKTLCLVRISQARGRTLGPWGPYLEASVGRQMMPAA